MNSSYKSKKIAVLITSNNNIELFEKFPDAVHIALDYSIKQLNPKRKLEYFLKYSNHDNNSSHLAFEIANKWYRDENGVDVSDNDFSMGLVMEWRLSVVIANIIRYYNAFNAWLKKVDVIIIPDNIPVLFKDVAQCFSDRVKFVDGKNSCYETFYFPMKHAEIKPFVVSKLSVFARILQRPLLKKKQNKVLCFSDWTYEKQRNRSFLYMNSYNPINGFYLNANKKKSSHIKNVFQYDLAHDTIERILKKSCIECDYLLCDLILKKIECEFFLAKDKAIYAYFLFKELLRYYKPASIILPGTTYPWYSMIMQIADSCHVPVLIVVDGYQTYVNKYQFPINKENNQILVKNYAVMGYAGEKLMSSKQFSMVNKIRIKPPLLDFYNQISLNLSDRSYDAMILFPYPILSNPNSKGDLRFMYIIEVLECLESIGLNSLLVKVKDGNNGKDIETLREILSIHAHDNVEVTTGAFHKYVNLVTFVVGGVGTSIAESLYNDTPYYVYEPYYNGIVDSDINNSILNNSLIFRDIEALKTGILNRSYLMLDKENLFSGIKMSEIDFKEL